MRKVGVRQIAKIAGVSLGTVDRALNNREGISKSTRQHILAIAEQLNYKPDLAARALSAGRVPTLVGVCIPREIRHYFDWHRYGSEEIRAAWDSDDPPS